MIQQRGRSFVVIMIVIACSAVVLRFAVMGWLTFTIAQNEASAEESLRLVATALENYAADHNHAYPANLDALVQTNPPYITKEYLGPSYSRGYIFSCPRVEPSGYTCTVLPIRCQATGKKAMAITTGQVMTAEDCARAE